MTFETGDPIVAPGATGDWPAFWQRRARLTDAGRTVLSGVLDWVELGSIDRWLGGVRLHGAATPWRWHAVAGRLEQAKV